MAKAKNQEDRVAELSVQSRARGENLVGPSILTWLTVAGQLIPPWWSTQRDIELRRFWRKIDHLAGAVYTFQSRMSSIPFRVEPRDMSISSHVRQAEKFTEMLMENAEFGDGWNSFFEPWVEDLLTQDNGAFVEVIGDGKPDGPIVGPALGIAHLDSAQCQRTGDPEFPVLYTDTGTGKIYKLHRTRVIIASQMPSANARMHGVGFCAVSRCINVAQSLYDILVYKQEKLGSRPPRGLMVTRGGLTPDHIVSAFRQANEMMNNAELARFSKIVVVGSDDAPDASVDLTDFASLPDGFDEQQSVTLAMAAIALAFGVDARELFPGLSTGATRAEALIAHLKQRGKGYGQTLQTVERKFSQKILPPHLKLVFDYQDDAQDMQVAEIRAKRADTRATNITVEITDVRTERENMLRDGDITQAQFERMELADGRLPDGSDVLSLFANKDFADLLDLGAGIDSPLDTKANDKARVLDACEVRRAQLVTMMGAAQNNRRRQEIAQAIAAIKALEKLYGRAGVRRSQPKPGANGKPPSRRRDRGLTEEESMVPPEPGSADLDLDLSAKSLEVEEIVENMRLARKTLEEVALVGTGEDGRGN